MFNISGMGLFRTPDMDLPGMPRLKIPPQLLLVDAPQHRLLR